MTRKEAIKMLVNATYAEEWQGNEELANANHIAIKSLEAWDEVLEWLETLESIMAKSICRYIKATLREVLDEQ